MVKRLIIKDKATGRFYHLSIARGCYKIRDYRRLKEAPNVIDCGMESELGANVWSKYEKEGVAPYHSVNDAAFWHGFLRRMRIRRVGTALLEKISGLVKNVASKLKPVFELMKFRG